MGLLRSLANALDDIENARVEKDYKATPPRGLGPDDFDSFDVAQAARKKPRNAETIEEQIRQANPARYRRLKRDYRWMQRQMKKMGLNPLDAKELL